MIRHFSPEALGFISRDVDGSFCVQTLAASMPVIDAGFDSLANFDCLAAANSARMSASHKFVSDNAKSANGEVKELPFA
jgi:hypothetical protein